MLQLHRSWEEASTGLGLAHLDLIKQDLYILNQAGLLDEDFFASVATNQHGFATINITLANLRIHTSTSIRGIPYRRGKDLLAQTMLVDV
eukprot:scaffold88409_cov42-Prasinocladus_malaysianus.AAC.2